MSFAPVLPMSGVAGWSLLQRVETDQRAQFARSPEIRREAEDFTARIAQADTPGKLVQDRRLLAVALTAFGLEAEIDKRAFIRAALESDLNDPESFANRLVDKRYRKLAEAFGYASLVGPRVAEPGFAAGIAESYKARSFELAIGESDPAMRLALNARRELANYAEAKDPERAAWFSVMGDRPVREVLETAFGLPEGFGQLDLDQQLAEFRRASADLLGDGSLKVFADPENVETVIRRYLARDSLDAGPSGFTRGAAALTLLQQGGAGIAGLVQARFG